MKKAFSVLAALCLLTACFSAFADDSDGSPLVLEDFTLQLDAGRNYQMTGEGDNLSVKVTELSEDETAQIIITRRSMPDLSYEDFKDRIRSSMPGMEENMKENARAGGAEISSVEMGDLYDTEVNGAVCCGFDIAMAFTFSLAGEKFTTDVYNVFLFCPSKGYTFNITALDTKGAGEVLRWLESAFAWN